jgi:hypothetical protein
MEIIIFIPCRSYIVTVGLIGFFIILIFVGFISLSLCGAILLWDPKRKTNAGYVAGQVISSLFLIIGIICGVVLNFGLAIGFGLNVLYYTDLTVIFILNLIAFTLKQKEKAEKIKASHVRIKRNDEKKRETVENGAIEEKSKGIAGIKGVYMGAFFLLYG